jgi:hypothetical protein
MGNAGRNGGEYYTPRPLIRAIVQVVKPKIGEKIYDGAVGSAGFTFVNGPSWPDFVKALGLGDEASKTAGAVYTVSVYRAAPGHRDDLEKQLSEAPNAGDTVAGMVLMQHLEGAAWQFIGISRYNSWQDFATSESASVAMTNKGRGGWSRLRDVSSYHTDTIADRIAP